MKKLLIVIFFMASLVYPHDYKKLNDHQWYQIEFYPDYKDFFTILNGSEYILCRLNSQGRWTIKRYHDQTIIDFFELLTTYNFEATYITYDKISIFFGDTRASFNCLLFPEKLANCPHIINIKKAY